VTLTGIAVLVLLFRWRRRAHGAPAVPGVVPLAAGAFVAFVVGIGVVARLGRGGPFDVERVAVAFRAGVGPAVFGAVVLAALALGACLLPPPWRRPVAAVAAVFGGLALLGTVVGLVVGAVDGGARMAGVAMLAGADVLGLVPWSLGVPWDLGADGSPDHYWTGSTIRWARGRGGWRSS
jgi:hypothetical protein